MTDFHKGVLEAIDQYDADRLRQLLEAENATSDSIDAAEHGLLHHAAASGSLEITKLLLDAGATVEPLEPNKGSPLHWAASMGHTDVCELLIAGGADLYRTDDWGEGGTPLVQAIFYAQRDCADALARHAITPSNLRVAAGLGRMDLIHPFFDGGGRLLQRAGDAREWYRPHDEFPTKPTTCDAQEVLDEALCYACFNNRPEAAMFLLDHGANPNSKPHFATALHFATAAGNAELIDVLLERGADPTRTDDNYDSTAAGWAEWGGAHELAEQLVVAASRFSLKAACAAGDFEQVAKRLGEETLEATELSAALEEAVWYEQDHVAELLRTKGAILSLPIAARLGQLEDVKRRLEEGASPNETIDVEIAMPGEGAQPRPMPALLAAAMNRNSDVCEVLLSAGAEPDAYSAAALGNTKQLEQFLDNGHQLGSQDPFGRTVLHRAIQGHSLETVRFLLERGSDPANEPIDYFTFGGRALHLAAEEGAPPEMLDLLIEFGADVNHDTNPGTPLDCALRRENEATADYLRELGGKTGEQLREERTG